jgi:hypothetical protein
VYYVFAIFLFVVTLILIALFFMSLKLLWVSKEEKIRKDAKYAFKASTILMIPTFIGSMWILPGFESSLHARTAPVHVQSKNQSNTTTDKSIMYKDPAHYDFTKIVAIVSNGNNLNISGQVTNDGGLEGTASATGICYVYDTDSTLLQKGQFDVGRLKPNESHPFHVLIVLPKSFPNGQWTHWMKFDVK